MLKTMHYEGRRARKLLRIAIVVAVFGCVFHRAHKDYAKPMPATASLSTASTSASHINGLEEFQATAYCVTGITKSGVMAAPGLVAADPKVIPLGSMIYVDSPLMGGIYQVLDTGELVKGKIIDIFIPSYERCIKFGRRIVKLKVLRYGFLGYPPENQPSE
jgi:3D (Asp-Asp-Asp) domain-containing protein